MTTTRELSRSSLVLTDDWGEEFVVYGGRTLTVVVHSQPVEVRLSSTQRPDRPLWSDPVRLLPGEWSRARSFGFVQFRNAVRGATASIDFYAVGEVD